MTLISDIDEEIQMEPKEEEAKRSSVPNFKFVSNLNSKRSVMLNQFRVYPGEEMINPREAARSVSAVIN